MCREKLEEMFTDTKYPENIVKQLEDIYDRVIALQYDIGTLKHLKKVLEEISKNY
jgi:tRNA splicing ligase